VDLIVLAVDIPGFCLGNLLGSLLAPTSFTVPILLIASAVNDVILHSLSSPLIKGLLIKTETAIHDVYNAISSIAGGHRYISKSVLARRAALHADPNAFFKVLSNKELAILPLIAMANDDASIGAALHRHPLTIKSHRLSIIRKLGLRSTEELVLWSNVHGFRPQS
jgi:two-component system response regulator NreC